MKLHTLVTHFLVGTVWSEMLIISVPLTLTLSGTTWVLQHGCVFNYLPGESEKLQEMTGSCITSSHAASLSFVSLTGGFVQSKPFFKCVCSVCSESMKQLIYVEWATWFRAVRTVFIFQTTSLLNYMNTAADTDADKRKKQKLSSFKWSKLSGPCSEWDEPIQADESAAANS